MWKIKPGSGVAGRLGENDPQPAVAAVARTDRPGAELLLQVVTGREERACIAVATEGPFSCSPNRLIKPRLRAPIVEWLGPTATSATAYTNNPNRSLASKASRELH